MALGTIIAGPYGSMRDRRIPGSVKVWCTACPHMAWVSPSNQDVLGAGYDTICAACFFASGVDHRTVFLRPEVVKELRMYGYGHVADYLLAHCPLEGL